MSHEFVGLTMDEIYANYNDAESVEILKELKLKN